jgi:hypothetical protein
MALTFENVWEGTEGTQERVQLLYDDIKACSLKGILYGDFTWYKRQGH